MYNDPQNQPISAQPGYGLLNVTLNWLSADGNWEASLYGTNLTSKVYYISISNGLSTYNDVTGEPGAPREFLFTVRRNFRVSGSPDHPGGSPAGSHHGCGTQRGVGGRGGPAKE